MPGAMPGTLSGFFEKRSMLKKIVLAAVVVAAVAIPLVIACNGEDDPVDAHTAITAKKTYVSADKGSTFVSVTAKGDWTVSLSYSDEGGWATLSPTSGSGDKGDLILSFEANGSEDSREVTLHLTVKNGLPAEATVIQSGVSSGGGVTPVGEYGYGYDTAPMDWLELPATMEGDGRELLVHAMDGGKYLSVGKSGTRNWSCYWDYKEHLSPWVAYPLNNSLKGSGGRSNDWHMDPLLPASLQPNLTNGSYGGGWTRGHQIPSADRVKTVAANSSTFVPTNMTPQDYDFNAGIWASLEGRVRDYAGRSDTLYVVTGCCIDKSVRTSGTSSGFAVKIPTHYFKALLFKGSSTYTVADGYMAAGFLLPHDSGISEGNYLDYLMSIDELEEKTGFDFFPNLVTRIGADKAARVESTAPSNFWK